MAQKYDPHETFNLSRSKLEMICTCPGCYWLHVVKGMGEPKSFPFNINTATDILLKADADKYRGKEAHPTMAKFGYPQIRPYACDELEDWVKAGKYRSPDGFNHIDEETNIRVGGGIDDIFEDMNTGELHIVDYKSTSIKGRKFNSPGELYEPYERQLDIYHWIGKGLGLNLSDKAFVIYVNGDQEAGGMIDEKDPSVSYMKFHTSVIEYKVRKGWVSEKLKEVRPLWESPKRPPCVPEVFKGESSPCAMGVLLDDYDRIG